MVSQCHFKRIIGSTPCSAPGSMTYEFEIKRLFFLVCNLFKERQLSQLKQKRSCASDLTSHLSNLARQERNGSENRQRNAKCRVDGGDISRYLLPALDSRKQCGT